MRVTTRTHEAHAEQRRAHGFHPIKIILRLKLRRNRTALGGGGIHPHKAGGHLLFQRGLRQHVAGQLPDEKLIERLIPVEGAHHPVAVGVNGAFVVEVQSVRVAVAHGIQPIARLMLTVMRAGQQCIHQPFVGARFFVGQKLIQQSRFRRQPRQHQSRTACERWLVGCRRKVDPLGLQLPANQRVDGVTRPVGPMFLGRHKGPVLGVFSAFLHPLRQ